MLQLLIGGAGREERRKELPGPHSAPLMRTPSPPGIPSLDLGDDVRSLERGSSDEGNVSLEVHVHIQRLIRFPLFSDSLASVDRAPV